MCRDNHFDPRGVLLAALPKSVHGLRDLIQRTSRERPDHLRSEVSLQRQRI